MEEDFVKVKDDFNMLTIIPKEIFDIYLKEIRHFPELLENESFINNYIKLVDKQNEILKSFTKGEK